MCPWATFLASGGAFQFLGILYAIHRSHMDVADALGHLSIGSKIVPMLKQAGSTPNYSQKGIQHISGWGRIAWLHADQTTLPGTVHMRRRSYVAGITGTEQK